jgi:hypothetical protein
MHRHHSIGPYQSQQRRRDEERRRADDRDHFEPHRDVRPHDDGPQFGPARPDLDRGMRGGPAVGEAGAYGPRSDMMGYGGFEPGAYGRDDASDLPSSTPMLEERHVSERRDDYNMYSRDDDLRPRRRFSLFRRTHRR